MTNTQTYTKNPTTEKALELFFTFDTDTQLALLWYGYLDIKDQLDPAPPNSVEVMGKTVFDQVAALPKEEQLQAQRDMITGAGDIGRTYQALDIGARIEVWLLLGQGMEQGTIIQVPSDYELPDNTNEFVEAIKQVNFEERINFMRSAVMRMG
ncbi:orange carotenoid protein N-terminal domain-containing protein [Gloeothece verrucosa]|uniref:Orange carotenoid protein n=1 Tax=Gloeothece verrucosa (strain PCC 7822) TaxID=497965 RepID=E0UHE4_GLOV7|nr:orange carotenoid protein N-terminal domain-containing protein [Gloeothece verrucosa]ADN12085.1 Orange carotenoid protein [Gloeothece verrucosa PCC 7822]